MSAGNELGRIDVCWHCGGSVAGDHWASHWCWSGPPPAYMAPAIALQIQRDRDQRVVARRALAVSEDDSKESKESKESKGDG